MKRRQFIMLVGGAAAWPLAARAQQPAMPVVGYLFIGSAGSYANQVVAFRQGLGETGYVEGRNVAIEFRWAQDRYDRLPALAAELVGRQVAVIAAFGPPAALAAKAATSTIPIVFSTGADPVAIGLVASLNRPGGNVTGVTSLSVEVGPKMLELLRELIPAAMNIAVLVNPTNPITEQLLRDLQAAARTTGQHILVLSASSEAEIDAAFATVAQSRADAVVIGGDGFFLGRSEQLAALTVRNAVPAISGSREFAAAGGLMSYGGSSTENLRQVGVFTGRILKGEKPADLPVQQATKIELVINLKTAKALGLTFPITLLGRADEVIE
jgi:putative ABC transport system substrate-binding protein